MNVSTQVPARFSTKNNIVQTIQYCKLYSIQESAHNKSILQGPRDEKV